MQFRRVAIAASRQQHVRKCGSPAATAQDDGLPQAYSAVATGTGGTVGAKTISFDFRIAKYTTDEELQNFAQLVKDQGTDSFRRALEKEDKGRINARGSTGNQIAVTRKRQVGSETIITILTARTMSFTELYRNGRTTDYPFGYLQVKLDSTGKGAGQITAAAKIRFDKKKGQYEIESFGNQYIKATTRPPAIIATATGQYPAAIVFSCVDSRAPAELILDFGIGDIFSGRVAGNVADEDVLGSMEFACKVAGSKVVLVMGHTACGAIKGAIDGVQLGNLTASEKTKKDIKDGSDHSTIDVLGNGPLF